MNNTIKAMSPNTPTAEANALRFAARILSTHTAADCERIAQWALSYAKVKGSTHEPTRVFAQAVHDFIMDVLRRADAADPAETDIYAQRTAEYEADEVNDQLQFVEPTWYVVLRFYTDDNKYMVDGCETTGNPEWATSWTLEISKERYRQLQRTFQENNHIVESDLRGGYKMTEQVYHSLVTSVKLEPEPPQTAPNLEGLSRADADEMAQAEVAYLTTLSGYEI